MANFLRLFLCLPGTGKLCFHFISLCLFSQKETLIILRFKDANLSMSALLPLASHSSNKVHSPTLYKSLTFQQCRFHNKGYTVLNKYYNFSTAYLTNIMIFLSLIHVKYCLIWSQGNIVCIIIQSKVYSLGVNQTR